MCTCKQSQRIDLDGIEVRVVVHAEPSGERSEVVIVDRDGEQRIPLTMRPAKCEVAA